MGKMKVCAKCKKAKPLEDFYKNPHYAGGRTAYCKKCLREKQKAYYASHREQVLARQKKERNANLEGARGYGRAYYAQNRDKLLAHKKAKREGRKAVWKD